MAAWNQGQSLGGPGDRECSLSHRAGVLGTVGGFARKRDSAALTTHAASRTVATPTWGQGAGSTQPLRIHRRRLPPTFTGRPGMAATAPRYRHGRCRPYCRGTRRSERAAPRTVPWPGRPLPGTTRPTPSGRSTRRTSSCWPKPHTWSGVRARPSRGGPAPTGLGWRRGRSPRRPTAPSGSASSWSCAATNPGRRVDRQGRAPGRRGRRLRGDRVHAVLRRHGPAGDG